MNPDNLEEFSPEWFDACSKAWMKNKKRMGASYVYVCEKEGCKNKVLMNHSDHCKWHAQQIKQTRQSDRIKAMKEK